MKFLKVLLCKCCRKSVEEKEEDEQVPHVDLDGIALLDLVVVDHDGLQDDVDDIACDEVCHDEVDSDDDQDELVDVVGNALPDVLADMSMKLVKVICKMLSVCAP